LRWFEILIPDRSDLEGAVATLEAGGIAIDRTDAGVLVSDPSGNRMLLRTPSDA
jgi:hypothetical protein